MRRPIQFVLTTSCVVTMLNAGAAAVVLTSQAQRIVSGDLWPSTQGANEVFLTSRDIGTDTYRSLSGTGGFYGTPGAPFEIPSAYTRSNGFNLHPSRILQGQSDRDSVMRVVLRGATSARIQGSFTTDGNSTSGYIYLGSGGWRTPLFGPSSGGSFDFVIPVSEGSELYFAVNAGSNDVNDNSSGFVGVELTAGCAKSVDIPNAVLQRSSNTYASAEFDRYVNSLASDDPVRTRLIAARPQYTITNKACELASMAMALRGLGLDSTATAESLNDTMIAHDVAEGPADTPGGFSRVTGARFFQDQQGNDVPVLQSAEPTPDTWRALYPALAPFQEAPATSTSIRAALEGGKVPLIRSKSHWVVVRGMRPRAGDCNQVEFDVLDPNVLESGWKTADELSARGFTQKVRIVSRSMPRAAATDVYVSASGDASVVVTRSDTTVVSFDALGLVGTPPSGAEHEVTYPKFRPELGISDADIDLISASLPARVRLPQLPIGRYVATATARGAGPVSVGLGSESQLIVPVMGFLGAGESISHQFDVRACVADTDDGSRTGAPDGGVTVDDLLYFLAGFEAGIAAADLDNDSDPLIGTPDGAVTIDDLLFFLARFELGC